MNDNRWTKRTTYWCPYNDKRSKKRPGTRWGDEREKFAGKTCQRVAQDWLEDIRYKQRRTEEQNAYVPQT